MAQQVTILNPDNTVSATIIQFNAGTQLPIKLTGSTNFATWKAQISTLMHGHDLFGHLDGTKPAPTKTITQANVEVPNPAYHLWFHQDQLIQNALMVSVDPTLASLVANAPNAHTAWKTLHTAFANKSQTRIFSLRDQLARLNKDSQTVAVYLRQIRSIADELATAGAPVSNEEMVVKILSGLGTEFREISAAIRTRESTITYEELYEKLVDHELFLKHEETNSPAAQPITAAVAQHQPSRTNRNSYSNNQARRSNYTPGLNQNQQWRNQQSRPRRNNNTAHQQSSNNDFGSRCQLCERPGHSARVCRSQSHDHMQARAYHVSTTQQQDPWIIDTGATHHIVSDTQPFTTLQDYNGSEDIVVGNGETIPISHTGNIDLNASN